MRDGGRNGCRLSWSCREQRSLYAKEIAPTARAWPAAHLTPKTFWRLLYCRNWNIWKSKHTRTHTHTRTNERTHSPTPAFMSRKIKRRLWADYEKIMRRLWVDYERVVRFEFWSWGFEVYGKSSWATHFSSLRPDRQSVLTNVRPTKLDKKSGDIRGPTDRWVLKGYLWADYERIMRRLWETEGHTVSRLLCLASYRNKNNKYIVCPPLASLRQDKKGA